MNGELFTIGHSTHATEYFIDLLKQHAITAVCDVRSQPYSEYNPQFNREQIREDLKKNSIAYVYLGKELGARSENPDCYENGKVQFKRLADDTLFQQGLDRLRHGMQQYSIAMMCAEKDPLICHRMILVCRNIRDTGIQIKHICSNGSVETNAEAEDRLLAMLKISPGLFADEKNKCLEMAYNKQGQKIAYVVKEKESRAGGI